jgi:hypothetical protein
MADGIERDWGAELQLASPFSEEFPAERRAFEANDAAWREAASPFALETDGGDGEDEGDRLYALALAELGDDEFDDALAELAEEVEQVIGERFSRETPDTVDQRRRLADAQLAPVRFEVDRYLGALSEGVARLDVDSLSDDELDEALDQFDPSASDLSPAAEQFLGSLVRKARSVVKVVKAAAKTAGKLAAPLLMPALQKLKGLVTPLLRRVLSMAIGRLPQPLQPVARTLIQRMGSALAQSEADDDEGMSPANATDVEMLAESFDSALAEALVGDGGGPSFEAEGPGAEESEAAVESRALERLAEARSRLIDQLNEGADPEDAVEQFVPVLLGALKLGIRLVGRPKVVSFLAKYVGQAIGKWIGPEQSGPLSNAIVDTGLRLMSLEAEAGDQEQGALALAGVVEDTVRRMAESENYVLDNEQLTQLAAADAFGGAVATYFPQRFVRTGLQQAPSLGGVFVTRRARSIRPYQKYSRAPEVEISEQIADALPTFGGTLGAALRAAGIPFPVRARMHIYQAGIGTSLPGAMAHDLRRRPAVLTANAAIHPLVPAASGMLLREPRLGAAVPDLYLRSPRRIAAGQRFYSLEALEAPATVAPVAATGRLAPSGSRVRVDKARGQIDVRIFLAEAVAQPVAEAIRRGRGTAPLLKALVDTFDAAHRQPARDRRPGHRHGRLRGWLLPALAKWVQGNGEAFARAAAHPDAGVTLHIKLTGVPRLGANGAIAGALAAARAAPAIAIEVKPGRGRK